ncbi:hypothetical protein [Candidatus Chlorohelix sp.]
MAISVMIFYVINHASKRPFKRIYQPKEDVEPRPYQSEPISLSTPL